MRPTSIIAAGAIAMLASAAAPTLAAAAPETPLILPKSSGRVSRARGGTFKQKMRKQMARNAKRAAGR